ncbi:hypothetical protein [Actinomadura atramentaria]|uniref:hypothetical protein n=1 Tax=Actinomadura atramentaria TaxID=1990 RepID=UPI00036C616E|nr:hypothetical protein [Actinomadura atramentaria]
MRLLVATSLGAVLVTAGLAAPSGAASIAGPPDETAPGRRTPISAPGCGAGGLASSPAFAAPVRLDDEGAGVAVVRAQARPGRYPVTARCGPRTVRGAIEVEQRRAWRILLPPSLGSDSG